MSQTHHSRVAMRAEFVKLARPALLFVSTFATLTIGSVWLASSRYPIGWDNVYQEQASFQCALGIANGDYGKIAYFQLPVDRPYQSRVQDEWFLGFRSAALGVRYSGTFHAPGTLLCGTCSLICYAVYAPVWLLLICAGVYPGWAGILAIGHAWHRNRAHWRCVDCDYDLTGILRGRCPECGTATTNVPPEVLFQYRLARPRRTAKPQILPA